MASNPQVSKRSDEKQNFSKISPLVTLSAGRRNLVGVCGFGQTDAKDVQEQDKPGPQVSASSAPTQKPIRNFEKVKIGKNAITFLFIKLSS